MEIQHSERNPVVPRLIPLDQHINGRVQAGVAGACQRWVKLAYP
jgi:hypothetical protein